MASPHGGKEADSMSDIEPDKYCYTHNCFYAPILGCERCATDSRAIFEKAYMAALPMLAANESAENAVGCAAEVALETVRRWPSLMATAHATARLWAGTQP